MSKSLDPAAIAPDRYARKRAAAEAATLLVEDGMTVGLGSGSTAAFAVEALAKRQQQGLRFVAVPTSVRTAQQAESLGIRISTLTGHQQIDLTIDGADEVERGTLDLVKGMGGALLREKIVAAATRRLLIVVDESKLVDRLGSRAPVPVEVVEFGHEATRARLEALGAKVALRLSPSGTPFVTDSGHRILDCEFGPIDQPAHLEQRIGRIVGVVESGLFVDRTSAVFVADSTGVRRFEALDSRDENPPVLVVMGISGAGKTTLARELAVRLGWSFEEGDALHPKTNVDKMRAGLPLDDADRQPWLEAVAGWIDAQCRTGRPGIITCSALKRSYRRSIVGDHKEVRLVYLEGDPDLLAARLVGRRGHFMPAGLLQSQLDTLEPPSLDEHPITVDAGLPVVEIAERVIFLLGRAESPSARAISGDPGE